MQLNVQSRTALHTACLCQNLDALTQLLVAKADLRTPQDRFGKVPYQYAIGPLSTFELSILLCGYLSETESVSTLVCIVCCCHSGKDALPSIAPTFSAAVQRALQRNADLGLGALTSCIDCQP